MDPSSYLTAVRRRLIATPEIAALVGNDEATARIYPAETLAVGADAEALGGNQPRYPLIVYYPAAGRWSVSPEITVDPVILWVQAYSKVSLAEALNLYGFIHSALHNRKQQVSTAECCIAEIRENMVARWQWIAEDAVWQVSTRFLIRASFLG